MAHQRQMTPDSAESVAEIWTSGRVDRLESAGFDAGAIVSAGVATPSPRVCRWQTRGPIAVLA